MSWHRKNQRNLEKWPVLGKYKTGMNFQNWEGRGPATYQTKLFPATVNDSYRNCLTAMIAPKGCATKY